MVEALYDIHGLIKGREYKMYDTSKESYLIEVIDGVKVYLGKNLFGEVV